jgi:ubiquinone/menaquinone biosynthesis C-methylase UbiE
MADEVVPPATFGGMIAAGEIPSERYVGALQGDATRLPFASNSFDRVITSEVLLHIQDDVAALAELVRVLKPGGTFAQRFLRGIRRRSTGCSATSTTR